MLRGISIGYLAIAVFAGSGLFINLTIANTYGAEGLGIFAQLLSMYLIAGQLVSGSIHASILKDVAANTSNKSVINRIIATSLVTGTLISVPVALCIALLAHPISALMDSEQLTGNIYFLAIALLPFSLNKILLGILNGLDRIRTYHLCNIFKYSILAFSILYFCAQDIDIRKIAITVVFSESITTILILSQFRNIISIIDLRPDIQWFRKLIRYLRDGYTASIYPEVNIRVDLLMIGIFMSDEHVGIYSISSAIYEGITTLLTVYRVSVNPPISRMLQNARYQQVLDLIKDTSRSIFPGLLFFIIISAIFYDSAIGYVFSDPAILLSYYPTHILLFFTLLVCWLVPFNQLFIHTGEIRIYTSTQRSAFILNILLNALLINIFGIEGAATATGIALIFGELFWYRRFKSRI